MAEPGAVHLSIGEVLGLLLEEFPDVTISKIRFLESQGLIEPERTPSGYRKFFDEDVELLRVILREQREKFLPLRVIKDRLDSGQIDSRDPTPPRGATGDPERVGAEPSRATVAGHPAARPPAPSRSTAPSIGTTPSTPAPAAQAASVDRARPPSRPPPACCRGSWSTARSCARWRR